MGAAGLMPKRSSHVYYSKQKCRYAAEMDQLRSPDRLVKAIMIDVCLNLDFVYFQLTL